MWHYINKTKGCGVIVLEYRQGCVPHELHVDGCVVCGWLLAVLVDVCDVLCELQVFLGVWFVLDKPKQVKTREQCCWKLDVLLDGFAWVVAAERRIRRRQDRAARVQRCHYTCLKDTHTCVSSYSNSEQKKHTECKLIKIIYTNMPDSYIIDHTH